MKMNYTTLSQLHHALEEISNNKMPFKLSMIIAKNLNMLKKEDEFYIEQERRFALEYLVIDAEKGVFEQSAPNVFRIKEGKEEECRKAREDLDAFEFDVALHMIPVALIETMEFTPNQLSALEVILEEE